MRKHLRILLATPGIQIMRLFSTTVCIMLCALSAPSYTAAQYEFRQELSAIPTGLGVPELRFGQAVAVEDNLAVVSTSAINGPVKIRTYRLTAGEWQRVASAVIDLSVGSVREMDLTNGVLAITTNDNAVSRIMIYRFTPLSDQWGMEMSATANSPQGFLSLASGGNIVVAGEPSHNSNSGRILVLRRDNNNIWQTQFLTPTAPQIGARFGASVAIVSGAIAVGAPLEDVTNASATLITNAGAAYVFTLTINTWTQVARLTQPNNLLLSGQNFSESIAISGADPGTPDRMLIAVPSGDASNQLGSVYRYRFQSNAWMRLADSIAPPSGALDTDGFACTMKLDGDWAAIGICTKDTVAGINSGAVLLVNFGSAFGTVLSSTLRTDASAAQDDRLGAALALDRTGPTIVAGSPFADLYGNMNQGVVLIGRGPTSPAPFLERRIDVGQGLTDALTSVAAADGNTVMIGAPLEDIGTQNARGAVYVYHRGTDGLLRFSSRLVAPDGFPENYFGASIALDGDIALIGASGRTLAGFESAGAVYVFRRSGSVWALEAQLLPPVPSREGFFGSSVALSGSTALIGQRSVSSSFFERATNGTWSRTQTIAHRGFPVQLSGDLAVLGDRFDGINNQGKVSTYTLANGTWQLGNELLGSDSPQRFGTSISLAGDLLAVASETVGKPVQIFRRSGAGWLPEASVQPLDVTATTYCTSVAVRAGQLAFGCQENDSTRIGSVYILKNQLNTWVQTQKLTLVPSRQFDFFGSALTFVAAGVLFASSPFRDLVFPNQGAVYLFSEPPDELFRDGFE